MNNFRERIIILILAIFPSMILYSQINKEELKINFERSLKEKGNKINTIKCKFEQERKMSVLSRSVYKKGVFYYSRPENILLSFDGGDYIKMSDKMFQMKNMETVVKTRISSNPMLRELNKLLSSCMTGDILNPTTGFSMNLLLEGKEYILELVPTNKRAASKVSLIEIRFDTSDMSLTNLKMIEVSGDYTSYRFYDKEFNIPLGEEIFTF